MLNPIPQIRDLAVIDALKTQGIEFLNYNWDQLLHAPTEIFSGAKTPYTVYTPFWKNWITKSKAKPVKTLENIQGLTEKEQEIAQQAGIINLPSAKDLGFIWDEELIITPGELAAQARLDNFAKSAINEYQEQRNFPAIDGTSQLSAALKFGVIGIRTIWQTTIEALANSNSEEVNASIQTWQKELAWREFYQHCYVPFSSIS